MAKQDEQRGPGRPATYGERMTETKVGLATQHEDAVDAWLADYGGASRSAAIRAMIERADRWRRSRAARRARR